MTADRSPPSIGLQSWLRRLAAAAMIFLSPMAIVPALADYRLQRGDVIEIGVSGSPELHRRIMIDDDGKIYFPVVGDVKVVGLSILQTRQKIHDLLVAQHVFDNPDITVDVAEYRPVYVSGDVAKPGAYPYRPGMTVRDAIMLAGGYGRAGPADAVDARDRLGSLTIKSVRLQIHIARLQAELADAVDIDLDGLRTDGATSALVSAFANLEVRQLKMENADYESEKNYLTQVANTIRDQISALSAEQEHLQSALDRAQENAARVQQLFRKSLAPLARVEDEQRATANSTAQLLELQARTAQARRDLEESVHKLQKLRDQRKIGITQRLEAAIGELATVNLGLAVRGGSVRWSAAEKVAGLGDDSAARDIVLFRRDGEDRRQLPAFGSTNLAPGDALEVAARAGADPVSLVLGTQALGLSAGRPSQAGERTEAAQWGGGSGVKRGTAIPSPPAVPEQPDEAGLATERTVVPGAGSDGLAPTEPAPAATVSRAR